MKKKVFTLLFALATFTAQAQVVLNETNFPDANFRASLAAKLGINEGDEITAEKIAKTTFLSVSNESIADLTGIEHFTALTSLGCSYNQLTSLDVSKNIALTSLACNKNQLTSLDVSKNTALTMLYCEYNQLATLDLSNQTGMTVKNVSTQYLTAKALKLADGRIGIDLGAEGFEAARFTELKADGAEISAEVTGQYLIIAENAESCPNKITYKYDTKYPIEATTMDVEIIPNTISLFTNAATFSNFKTVAVEKGKSVSIPMQITNKGKNHIKSISYTITTAGKASEESTISLNNLAFGTSADVSIKFPADIDVGKKLKMLTITKVNGEKNENLKRSATGNLITVSKRPVVVPVVEELTQTTCQWCPIGIEGMKETYEAFGDKVALIAAHLEDPMSIDDYNIHSIRFIFKDLSRPSSIINREIKAYPWGSTLISYCRSEMENKITVAEIIASATWKDMEKNTIQINSNTKFFYTEDDGQYGIAYILVEDGLTGWSQSNSLSNNPDFANKTSLAFWYNSPKVVSGIEFDHVPVAAWDVENGVDGSINSNIQEGESQIYSFEANIAEKKLIQNKSKLKVITLLIDRNTGKIVNAAQTKIHEDETGIDNVNTLDTQIVGKYDIDGRRITSSQRGLNIVKMSDGSVKKVVVK